jgi:hypothetical protein
MHSWFLNPSANFAVELVTVVSNIIARHEL